MTRKYDNPEWIGQRFGRLTVVGAVPYADSAGRKQIRWKTRCDCGNETLVVPFKVVSGETRSCGCLSLEMSRERFTKHGEAHTRLFYTWVGMRDRCNNPRNKRYENYGGRGITVCEEWENSYEAFAKWARENGYADNLTIDRIDVDGNYEPSNCRWADLKTQMRNRTDNHYITIDGVTRPLVEWCEIYGQKYSVVHSRITALGWDAKDALERPNGGSSANQVTYHPEKAKKPVQRKYRINRRYYEVDGEMLPLKVACERLGLPYKAVHLRITRYGMTVEEAIRKPFK